MNSKDFNINFSQLVEIGALIIGKIVKFDIILEGIEVSK